MGETTVNQDIQEILFSEEELDSIISRIAAQVDRDYGGGEKKLVLVCILKGSVVFMVDFMKVSSYGSDTVSSGSVNILLDINRKDLDTCDILIVEDIIDSGRTLSYLTRYLLDRGARSVRTCTMLDKPSRRVVEYDADYVGAVIDDLFVVGYGLDYAEKYRDLPYIGVLKPEVYGG